MEEGQVMIDFSSFERSILGIPVLNVLNMVMDEMAK